MYPTHVPTWKRSLIELGMTITQLSYEKQTDVLKAWMSELDRQSIADKKRGRPKLAHLLFVTSTTLAGCTETMICVSRALPQYGVTQLPGWKKDTARLGEAIGKMRYDKQIDITLGWRVVLVQQFKARGEIKAVSTEDYMLWGLDPKMGGVQLALEDLFRFCKPYMTHEFLHEDARTRAAMGK